MLPKPVVAAVAALVTIGFTLIFAAVAQEMKFFVYVPLAMKEYAEATESTPTPGPLADKVTALETRVATLETQMVAMSRLLTPTPSPTATPTPSYQVVKAQNLIKWGTYERDLGPYKVDLSVPATVSDSIGTIGYPGVYRIPFTLTVTLNGQPVPGATVTFHYLKTGFRLSDQVDCVLSCDEYTIREDSRYELTTNASGIVTETLALAYRHIGAFVNIRIQLELGEVRLNTLKTIRLE